MPTESIALIAFIVLCFAVVLAIALVLLPLFVWAFTTVPSR